MSDSFALRDTLHGMPEERDDACGVGGWLIFHALSMVSSCCVFPQVASWKDSEYSYASNVTRSKLWRSIRVTGAQRRPSLLRMSERVWTPYLITCSITDTVHDTSLATSV